MSLGTLRTATQAETGQLHGLQQTADSGCSPPALLPLGSRSKAPSARRAGQGCDNSLASISCWDSPAEDSTGVQLVLFLRALGGWMRLLGFED